MSWLDLSSCSGVADLRDDLADIEEYPADFIHGGSSPALLVAQIQRSAARSPAQSHRQQPLLRHLHQSQLLDDVIWNDDNSNMPGECALLRAGYAIVMAFGELNSGAPQYVGNAAQGRLPGCGVRGMACSNA